MGLGILHAGFKKGGLDVGGGGGVELHMLEPLGDLLARGCRSRHAPVTSLSLRCLARLAPSPLEDKRWARAAGKAVHDILAESARPDDDLALDAVKLLTALLRNCPLYAPSEPQIQRLIPVVFGEIEDAVAQRATSFGLLKAIVAGRLGTAVRRRPRPAVPAGVPPRRPATAAPSRLPRGEPGVPAPDRPRRGPGSAPSPGREVSPGSGRGPRRQAPAGLCRTALERRRPKDPRGGGRRLEDACRRGGPRGAPDAARTRRQSTS